MTKKILKKHKYPIVLIAIFFAFFASLFFKTKIVYAWTAPSVTLGDDSSGYYSSELIDFTSVILNGNLTSVGTYSGSATAGFVISPSITSGATTTTMTSTGYFHETLTGLAYCTTYTFYPYATNGSTVTGPTVSFKTSCFPTTVTGSASSISSTGVTLSQNLTSAGTTATSTGGSYFVEPMYGFDFWDSAVGLTLGFQYGTTTAYGATSTVAGTNSTGYPGTHTQNITGLSACTTYNYRAYAISQAHDGSYNSVYGVISGTTYPDQYMHVTVYGSNSTFTTTGCPPVLSTATSSSITTTSGTVSGVITDIGNYSSTATVGFQYGTTTAYGATSTTSTTVPATFTHSITGLSECTTYHYRFFAINGTTVNGSDSTFTTTCLTPPGVATDVASYITRTSATLGATLTILGSYATSTTVGFQYGTTTAYGATSTISSMSSAGAYSEDITGLTPGVAYHYRPFAINGSSVVYGTDSFFNALNLTIDGSTVYQQYDSLGLMFNLISTANQTIGFHYGTSTSYTATSSIISTPGIGWYITVTGLTPCTTYHYSAFSPSMGYSTPDGTVTSACLITGSSSSITGSSANMAGSFTPGSAPISYSGAIFGFQYGTTTAYGATSTLVDPSSTYYNITVTGLSICTTYHYRSYSAAVGAYIAGYGSDSTFTTTCPTPPTVTTTGSSLITSSSAKLAGTISYVGSYSSHVSAVGFHYGVDTSYGATSTVSGTFGTGPFTNNITGLSCGTTYHYRAFATDFNNGYGSDMTFTTSACSGSSGNVTGYMWSSNVGWISLNCLTGGSTGGSVCGSSPYSVNVVPNSSTQTGLFSGYAWSSNVGWVSFNGGDVTSCGAGGASSTNPGQQAKLKFPVTGSTTGQVTGWAKVLSASGGWDGCISLRGPSYGITYVSTASSNNLAGLSTNPSYAWGGSTMGWISSAWANVNFATSTVILSVNNPTLTSAGGTVSLAWTTANLATTACTASSTTGGGWSGSKSSGGGSDLLTFGPNTTSSTITKTYTLGCTGILGNPVNSLPLSITIAPGGTSTSSSLNFLANNAGSSTSTPITITSGNPVTLAWQMQNMTHGTCHGTSSGSFSGWNNTNKSPLSTDANVGTSTVTFSEVIPRGVITTNRTYTMTCTGTDSVVRMKTVYINVGTVDTAPSLVLTANGVTGTYAMPSSGGSLTLNWTTANLDAASCNAVSSDGSFTGAVDSGGGTYAIGTIAANTSTTTTITKTYTISGCTASGAGVPSSTVTVTVAPAGYPFISFYGSDGTNTGDNISVSPTATTTLSWTVANITANTCKGTSSGNYTGWLTTGSTKLPSSTITSTPATYNETEGLVTTNRTYTLTCTGTNGAVIFHTVNLSGSNSNLVNLSVNDGVDIIPNQTNVVLPSSGGTVNIVWTTTNLASSSCTASSSASDWTGSRSSAGGSNSLTIPANASAFAVTRTYTLSGCVDTTGATVPAETVSVTISPTGSPFLSFFVNGSGMSTSITSGSTANLGWRLQNISLNSCKGTSSGSYSNWNNTTKGPSPAVGSTSTTFYETVGLDGSITSTRTYTMGCGTLPPQTVTINMSTPCTGVLCTSTSTTLKATNRPPWMEI